MITFSLCLFFIGEDAINVRITKRLPPTKTNKKAENITGTVRGKSMFKKKDKKTKAAVVKHTDKAILTAALLFIYRRTALYRPSLTLAIKAIGSRQASRTQEGE